MHFILIFRNPLASHFLAINIHWTVYAGMLSTEVEDVILLLERRTEFDEVWFAQRVEDSLSSWRLEASHGAGH